MQIKDLEAQLDLDIDILEDAIHEIRENVLIGDFQTVLVLLKEMAQDVRVATNDFKMYTDAMKTQ